MKESEEELITKEGYILLKEEYRTVGKRKEKFLSLVHTLCKREFAIRKSKFFNEGQRCVCQRRKNYTKIKTADEYLKFLEDKGFQYNLASNFISIKKPIIVQCQSCNSMLTFKRAEAPIYCPNCSFKSQNKGEDFFERKLRPLGIEILHFDKDEKLNFIHAKFPCGHKEYLGREFLWNKFNRGKSKEIFCPHCGKFSKIKE